jgi:hypothetical protein
MVDFSSLRAALDHARAQVASALYAQARGRAADVTGARKQEAAAKQALNQAIAAHVQATPDAAQVLRGDLPIALMPVRLETRFVRVPPTGEPTGQVGVLRVRIYPDDLAASTHEPELTDDELLAGQQYWASGDRLASWGALVARYPSPRAAWIVRATASGQAPASRAHSWTRPAEAILPDRFRVVAYRGAASIGQWGGPVVEPLTLTIAPSVDAQKLVAAPNGDGLQLDADLLWTIDFQAAHDAGLGVELPLQEEDFRLGFDLVIAFGVKSTFALGDGSRHLGALLDAHHYTRGWAIVPQGTPTSHAPGVRAAWPPDDPAGASSFAVERQTVVTGDGAGLALALGLSPDSVAHVAGADVRDDGAAQAMLTALWPATLGYQLEQMMAPADASKPAMFDPRAVEAAYQFARTFARARGPLPAFRVGPTPYGLLPTTSLMRLAAADKTPLPSALAGLRARLLAAAAGAPMVRPESSTADDDLLSVLRLDASARSFLVQVLTGWDLQSRLGGVLGVDVATLLGIEAGWSTRVQPLLVDAGLPSANAPRVALASRGVSELYDGLLVARASADREQPLPDGANYITWIATQLAQKTTALADDALPDAYDRTLLYQLLRHAVLVEQQRASGAVREPEIVTAPAPRVTHTAETIAPRPPGLVVAGATNHLDDLQAALGTLAKLPIAELERLVGETLDLCSHRFDAWITSLATSRLADLRAGWKTNPPTTMPVHFGACGWVEQLKPASAPPSTAGGFMHAPSMNHARAAAVLRSGFLARNQPGSSEYALDLSSANVRDGLAFLARVRDGEALADLLGLEIETRLRADPPTAIKCLAALRQEFPSTSSPLADGLAAVRAWRAHAMKTPVPDAIMSDVDRRLDAAADLLTSEAVYRMVLGNAPGAAAGLDALSLGTRPPEPQIAHVPPSGVGLLHRVAVVLGDDVAPGWPVDASHPLSPRGATGRYVDAWVGRLLGDPARVRCRVVAAAGAIVVSLADLVADPTALLRPLDLLALASQQLDGDSELERRILAHAKLAGASIVFDADPTWGSGAVTFPALLELARAVDLLVSSATPLAASHLAPPSSPVADTTNPDRAARAQSALNVLASLSPASPGGARAYLQQAAAFGIAGAYPRWDASDADLGAAVTRVQTEQGDRATRASKLTDAAEIARVVFGRAVPLVGAFTPPPGAANAKPPAGLGVNDALKWLQKAARARPALDRWRRARLYADELGAAPASLAVAQLPSSPNASWAALPGPPPPRGALSLVLERASGGAAWAGLLVDEWTELVPAPTQQTGVALNFHAPRAEAPLALLLAVPPANAATWSSDVLTDLVRETFELVKLRSLTPELLASFASLLPATCLSVNTAGDALSTPLYASTIAPVQVAGPVVGG